MKYYNKLKIYFPIAVWPALVLAFHLISQELSLYYYVRWLDTPMHFLGGMAIAAGSYYIFKHLEDKGELKTTPVVKIFLAIAITALAATLWEITEFAGDTLLQTHMQPGVWDTMKDLTMGLLGASLVSLLWKKS